MRKEQKDYVLFSYVRTLQDIGTQGKELLEQA
jgi:hypothetical protein